MDSFLGFIGSFLIGGLLLLSILTFQSDLRDYSYKHTNALIARDNAKGVIEVLEAEFFQIGAGIIGTAFVEHDSNSIKYSTDLDRDGTIDSVSYFLSNTLDSATPNPNDKILYRVVNNGPPLSIAMGVIDFKVKYFNSNGAETTFCTEITSVEVTLEMENTIPYDGEYSSFLWRKKITPEIYINFGN